MFFSAWRSGNRDGAQAALICRALAGKFSLGLTLAESIAWQRSPAAMGGKVMAKETKLTESRIRAAHNTAGDTTKNVLEALWPWLTERLFRKGATVFCNDGTTATVIGYSDDPVALAYFRSLPNGPSHRGMGFRLLAMKDGRPSWAKPVYFCLPGGIYDHG